MKKSLLLVPLFLAAIALPVKAVTPQEAEAIGFRSGMEICRAISRGAKTLWDIVLYSRPGYDRDFIDWVNTLPNNHPMYQAYRRGDNKGMEPCKKQFGAIVKRGWN